eukprot:TRINITY_DN24937_c0_g1_i1.p1 TRINITY_DN24937_c0_g1~~TRINITY_DN24937_c0_g1_i1.p1  ORF type:complete len:238 (+),score=20.87 TRINITY_DN24937_c0_g1_i1:65-778(+)
MVEQEQPTVPGWLWLGDKSWADDPCATETYSLTHRLCCAMTGDDSTKWMASWGSPCDCGAPGCTAPTDIGNALGLVEEGAPSKPPPEGQYVFESWTAAEAGANRTIGYAPLFDDEPFCRHHAEPLLVAGSDFIASAKSSGGKIYVHCEKGCSRSAAVVLCYLMRYENMSLLEAAVELKSRRVRVSPNAALVDALSRIEQASGSTSSIIDEVNAAFRKPWLPEYRAGRVRLNNVDLIL